MGVRAEFSRDLQETSSQQCSHITPHCDVTGVFAIAWYSTPSERPEILSLACVLSPSATAAPAEDGLSCVKSSGSAAGWGGQSPSTQLGANLPLCLRSSGHPYLLESLN